MSPNAIISEPHQEARAPQLRTVIGAALGMSVGFATLFVATAGVFVDPVTQEFGWGQEAGSLTYAASMLGLTVACPIVGRLMDRFGIRRVLLVCALLFSALVAALSMQNGNLLLWVAVSLLVGLVGAATTVLGYLAVLPQWFTGRLGLAIGCAMVGLGLGTVVAPLLAQSLITRFGWRGAYLALATITLVVSSIAVTLIRERHPKGMAEISSHGKPLAEYAPVPHPKRRISVIFLVAALVSGATLFLSPNIAGLFRDRVLDPTHVANALALTGVGIMIGRFLTGLLLDRIHAPFVATFFFGAGAVGFGVLYGAHAPAAALVACLLIGLAVGAEGDLLSYLVRVYLGLANFGKNYGIAFAGYGLGAVIGPVTAGRYIEKTGSYDLPLLVAPVLLVIAGALLLSLGRYNRPAHQDRKQSPLADDGAAETLAGRDQGEAVRVQPISGRR